MSWLLAMWISLGFLLLCRATLYQTIQQHHVARPGRTDILTLGTCASLSGLSFTARRDSVRRCPRDGGRQVSVLAAVKPTARELLQYVRTICHSAVTW